MENELEIPLAERLLRPPSFQSLFFLSVSISHTHTERHTDTHTFMTIYIGCKECKDSVDMKKSNIYINIYIYRYIFAPLIGEHCPSVWFWCVSYMHNIRLQYYTCVQTNICFQCFRNWFCLFDLNGIKCGLHFK